METLKEIALALLTVFVIAFIAYVVCTGICWMCVVCPPFGAMLIVTFIVYMIAEE